MGESLKTAIIFSVALPLPYGLSV
ncbi:uncharacterized protein METZ01_LOCUS470336, partial [marine metagenome]